MVFHDSTSGYGPDADLLARQYESIRFADVHRAILHLIPTAPCLALDIGAGTGRDAAALAAMGHRVVAVEPTLELRTRAALLHPSPHIEWVNDRLPELSKVSRRREQFGLIMLTAVWMHLDAGERREAMPRVAGLLRRGGILTLTLRHGPVPPGRRMFEVTAGETIELAGSAGLTLAVRLERQPDSFGRPEITWTRLAFSG